MKKTVKKYYFNGGLYDINGRYQEKVFEAVKPSSGNLPYVTDKENGINGAHHHSSVYQISDDFTSAELIKDNGVVQSPKKVNLSLDLQLRLKKAVKRFEERQQEQER